MITENKYRAVVTTMADRVPLGIERWVSFREAERFDPAIIPVTAGKNKPSKFLQNSWVNCHFPMPLSLLLQLGANPTI
jgi:hypothetical protein